jgi:hypothetical protein
MIQPEAAAGVLGDGVLRDQGLLSRFLIAAPDSLAGHRLWREPREQTEPALVSYSDRISALFEMPLVASNTAGNELVPQQLELSPDALPIWTAFHDSVEIRMRPDSAFAGMKDIAGKAAEQAGRIAGVLQMVEDVHAGFIESGPMERACQLVEWHMQEASRMARDALIPPATRDAVSLLGWLHRKRRETVSVATLQKDGPGVLRRKMRLDPALAVLEEHRWLIPLHGTGRSWQVVKPAIE